MKRRGQPLALIGILCLFACPALAEGISKKVPLVVQENGGVDRQENLITSGVPLLPGQVTDMSKLVLLDEAGKPVPCQFRDLARWRLPSGADGSLRWVLLDFKANLAAWGPSHFTLSDGGQPGPGPADSPLKATVTDDAIVVNTGPAQFTINRKKFNLFDRVRLDVNGDKEFSDDEEVLSPGSSADSGSVVTDTFGEKYFSSEGTTEVKVEESGPLRICVVAKGTHKARNGAGYSMGMYGFEIRMHFIAGTNLVKLDALITNNGAKCNGSPTFKDFSLIGKLNLGKSGRVARMYGTAPVNISVADGQSAVIYQDSVGSENWKISPGINGPKPGELSSFRGYRIIHKSEGKEDEVLHQGDNARGITGFGDGKFGVVIVPNYFWQLFPKAVEVSGDGGFRVGILPREYKAVHWIEDASAAGQVVWLNFYATKQKQQFYAVEGRPEPHVIDDSYSPRAMARCSNEHYAACGALADVGPYLPILPAKPGEGQVENEPIGVFTGDFPLEVTERRYMMTDYLKGNAFGWQVFGCRWEEYAGHSPWNYEPIGSSYFLFNYINTGGLRMLEFGLRRFKQFRDVRAYKIDGTDLWHCPNWGEYSKNNVAEEWCTRSSQWPKGEEVTKYSAGKYGRAGWFGPNPEHANLDDLHDLYCLTGDTRAYEGMRNIAAYGGAYSATRPGGIGRDTGWALRAVARYYDLTGDKNALDYLNRGVDCFWATARASRSAPMVKYDNNWFMDVYSRAAVIAFNVTGDERMRDLVIGLSRERANQPDAKQAERKYGWPTMLAFCWDQTGLPEFANDNCQRYARLGGYFPACAGYLWAKPRDDKQAPAAIKDLAGKPVDAGVELSWTAPGDDGDKGTAAVYQIKHDDLPIVELAKAGKESNFWAANNVPDEPKPAAAGTLQTYTVKGLKAGTHYFAIKTRDKVSNESPISNIVSVDVK